MAYATWNPEDKHAEISLSNSDLTATSNNAFGSLISARALSLGISAGKYYWEIYVDYENSNGVIIGIAKLAMSLAAYLGSDINGYGYYCVGRGYYNGSYVALSSFTTGDTIQIALDLDNGKIWWGKNGTWEASGDPGADTGEQYSGITGTWYPACSLKCLNEVTANFGDSVFSYSVPNGFESGVPVPEAEEEAEISEDVDVLSEFNDNWPELNENVNVLSEFDDNWPVNEEDVSVNSTFAALGSDKIDQDVSVNTEITAAHLGELSEDASVNVDFVSEHTAELSEDASVNSEFAVSRLLTIQDTLSAWETLCWGWQKTLSDSLDIADTAEKILGIPVKDWLTIKDTETTNWNGVESVSDGFYAVDISKVIKVYYDLVADGMDVTDAAKIALELVLIDILTCTDTVFNIGQFQHSIEDGMTLEDIAKRFFPKSVSDSFTVTDTSLVDFLALLQISDSLVVTDTADRLLTISKTIADSLEVLDTVTVQQLIQELIQDGLNISVSVVIDGEVWETWVLNTSAFHPSVYSNYEFNSFALFNNTVFGCKSDGIYELEGADDDGTPIRAGIILPSTRFGIDQKKRFRKAWFGVADDNLILKVETENGDKTYKMVDTECSLSRDLKGRSWQISVDGFESLDSINLVPIILSKK